MMNTNLTPEQVKLLQQLQKQKIQHRGSQKRYRESKSNYKEYIYIYIYIVKCLSVKVRN